MIVQMIGAASKQQSSLPCKTSPNGASAWWIRLGGATFVASRLPSFRVMAYQDVDQLRHDDLRDVDRNPGPEMGAGARQCGTGIVCSPLIEGWPGRWLTARITTKAALNSLTKALAVEHARYGVTANAILPGWVDIEMTEDLQATINSWPTRCGVG
jgi:NAD(P)-dependent dehydrogenase (short-subunit alcohol dehydrogenase family)